MTRASLVVLAACGGAYGHVESNLVFDRGSSLVRGDEIARRVLPPLTYRRMQQALAARNLALADTPVALAHERFDVYVPPGPPPAGGYGLVVFVAPWNEPTRPQKWSVPLDEHGLVFVAAQRSGNDQSLIDRRLPLALLAYDNARARYAIDPERVFVAGFSGGSRVAEIAALAYPDVFRGALLDAGADPIDGRDGIYKPPAELFARFQRSRIVFVTGDQDVDNLRQANLAMRDMLGACVLDIATEPAVGLGHEPLDRITFSRALDALVAPRHVDEAELARCNAKLRGEVDAALAAAHTRAQIDAIDKRFGGLAAPAIVELDRALGDGLSE